MRADVTFRGPDNQILSVTFQVTDVKKPLIAVDKLAEYGNLVQFGPHPESNFIQSVDGSVKIPMKKKGRSFVLRAGFVKKAEPPF